jgi:EAL and modified HD-GYP domain-containing signal transduction protein
MALTRARMCEILGAGRPDVTQDALFTIGLLSVADALLNVPLAEIVEELPLADEIALALLQRAGPAGDILDAVITYERGDFHDERLQSHRRDMGAAYRASLRWAGRTLAETV